MAWGRGCDQPRADSQLPVQEGRPLVVDLGCQGSRRPAGLQSGLLGGLSLQEPSQSHCLWGCPPAAGAQALSLPEAAARSKGTTCGAPPAKSDLATTGEVSQISPGPRQGWFSPRRTLPDTPHMSPYARSVTFPRLRRHLLLSRRLQPLINHPDKTLVLKATLPQRAASYVAYFALCLS